ncbi:MAG: substrate-binding domain-containing protein, partial [Victivallales bacterium]|nr:substrate-binding domain-containing protein [Victivallales bacterium]
LQDDTWLMEHLQEYDGIIFSDVQTDKLSPVIMEKLSRFRKQVSLDSSDHHIGRNTVVCTDENVAGRMAAEFLHRCGMERIALLGISHNLKAQYFQERVNGFINYWMENGSGVPHELHLTLSREMDAFCAAPTAFLEKLHLRENRVQAIFLITDLTAIVCLEALKKMGFRIPEDISVMGCDNLAESAATEPPLTTMAHPTDKIVNSIWEILISNLGLSQHPVNEGSTTFPPQLIQRGSVRPRS